MVLSQPEDDQGAFLLLDTLCLLDLGYGFPILCIFLVVCTSFESNGKLYVLSLGFDLVKNESTSFGHGALG